MAAFGPQFVYFLKPVNQAGPIKIGVSGDVPSRVGNYARWSPAPLELLVFIPGSFALERTLHNVFAYAHSHFEWFHPVEELMKGIYALKQGVPVEEAFDLSSAIEEGGRGPKFVGRFTPQYRQRFGFVQKLARKRHALNRAGIQHTESELARRVLDRRVSQIPLTPDEVTALNAELAHMDELLAGAA